MAQSCKKRVLRDLQNSTFFLPDFPPNLSSFPPFFSFFIVQMGKHWKNIIFTACKCFKLCIYYVNRMVLSCGTCQMERKKRTLGKYVIYVFLRQFQFCCNLCNFSAKSQFPDFDNWRKKCLLQLNGWDNTLVSPTLPNLPNGASLVQKLCPFCGIWLYGRFHVLYNTAKFYYIINLTATNFWSKYFV